MRARSGAIRALSAAAIGVGALTAALIGSPAMAQAPAATTVAPSVSLPPSTLSALSPEDARAYTAALVALRAGDEAAVRTAVASASDPLLTGWFEGQRLLANGGRAASYAELTAWLQTNRELTAAPRIHAIALGRRPAGAPALAAPGSASADLSLAVPRSAPPPRPTAAQQRARDLFYAGDAAGAYAAAVEADEPWIAGLAAFRLRNFGEAADRFAAYARTENDGWRQSAGAWWAARAAVAAGRPEQAPALLRMAANTGRTFYGLLAQRQLGIEPAIPARLVRAAFTSVEQSSRGRRVAAFHQLGLTVEAALELRDAVANAGDAGERAQWAALAQRLNLPAATAEARPADESAFPMPTLTPRGGFTLDPALVYAIVRQESRFNASARSRAGAAGLMQVMPATASFVVRRTGAGDPGRLTDPSNNLRLGQDYFAYLLQTRIVGQDMLRAVAAYNGGPGTVLRTQEQLAGDTDALMLIESLPYSETRAYVERVMANYWVYRRLLGQDTPTLDAVISGATVIRASLDQPQRQATSVAFTTEASFAGGSAP